MATTFTRPSRPGVYAYEGAFQRVIPLTSPLGTYGAFLGTALRGPTKPVYVQGMSEFYQVFGPYSTNVSLPAALSQYFANGGGPAYVQRVIANDAVASKREYFDSADHESGVHLFTLYAFADGLWGDNLSFAVKTSKKPIDGVDVDVFSLEVYENQRGKNVAVEFFADLTLDPATSRFAEKIVNSPTIGSRFVTFEAVEDDTSKVTDSGADLIALEGGSDGTVSGIDGSDYATAFEEFAGIEGMLLVNAPGIDEVQELASAVQSRGDSVIIADLPVDYNVNSDQSQVPSSSFLVAYHPWIYVNDPAPGSVRGSLQLVPPGATVAGMIARTDSQRGVFKAPAGVNAGLSNVVAPYVRLSDSDLDTLATSHINAIRSLQGIGTAVMGARTRWWEDVHQFLSVRRTTNYVKQRAILASRFALFEPNSPDLWEQLRVANGAYLSDLWVAGGLVGTSATDAFYVKVDASNNTPQTMANGELHVEIGIAPVFPAEFIIIHVGQIDGGSIFVEEG